ncbi:MAG: hypothetical protein V9E93_03545 [Steroidobacteraceae bacterium]
MYPRLLADGWPALTAEALALTAEALALALARNRSTNHRRKL